MKNAFQLQFNPHCDPSKASEHLKIMAEKLATLCLTLGEFPSIRYQKDHCQEFANLVQEKLDSYKKNDDLMAGKNYEKTKSTLLILDRRFDTISPILHEFTLQAMAFDLLPIKNDVYHFLLSSGNYLGICLI